MALDSLSVGEWYTVENHDVYVTDLVAHHDHVQSDGSANVTDFVVEHTTDPAEGDGVFGVDDVDWFLDHATPTEDR